MNFTGQVTGVARDWKTETWNITFSVNEGESALIELDKLQNVEKLSVDVKQYRKKRSLDANGLLWACLGEMAVATRADKWDIYLMMLKRYGKFTHVCVKPEALEDLKHQWRETEVVGELTINGKKAVQVLCYFGSSMYNTKEFSVLLDGVVSEMQDLGLQPPASEDMKRALEMWEAKNGKVNNS